MKQRAITAFIALPILLLILFSGSNFVMATSLMVLSIIGMNELYESFSNTKYALDKVYKNIGFTAAFALYFMAIIFDVNFMVSILLFFSFCTVAYGMFTYNTETTIANISIVVLSIVYIPCLFWYIYALYRIQSLIWFVGYIFIIAFGSDTCAYFAGITFGKKKVTPVLSPNKSLEGFIGGMLGSVIIVFIYTYLLSAFNLVHIDFSCILLVKLFALGLIGAFVSQIGDLLASAIKRTNGIKDFGNLMPGHGGVLDRFDSILMVSPFVYFFIILVLI